MADITRKGRELAKKLSPKIAPRKKTLELCSLICRAAVTHHHYAEAACNRQLTADEEHKVVLLERRITQLVDALPATSDGPFVAVFQHDPRGITVKIVIRGHETHHLYDGFANEAICVPQL